MNLEEYARSGRTLYEKLAEIIAGLLEREIADELEAVARRPK